MDSTVYSAPSDPKGPLPLIVALHGRGDNGRNFLGGTGLMQANAVVVAPTGAGLAWAPAPYALNTIEQDKARIDDIIAQTREQFDIDPGRIYAAGFSNGGGLAVYLSTLSDTFAGIASVSAAVRCSEDQIEAGNPVDYLNIHGTHDDVVPYDGEVRPGYGSPAEDGILGAPEVVATFERRNGDKARTLHRRVEGMGHEWPTGPWAAHRGIDVTEEIFDFFGIEKRTDLF